VFVPKCGPNFSVADRFDFPPLISRQARTIQGTHGRYHLDLAPGTPAS
jgi:hypothetical protein